MIKLSNAIVVANTSDELITLQGLLTTSYPEFLFEVVDNTGEEKETFPFKMQVNLDASAPDVVMPSMPDFFTLLVSKIDQLNQTV
jgi:hypothetical protein